MTGRLHAPLLPLLLTLVPAFAAAGSNNNAKVVLHVKPSSTDFPCSSSFSSRPPCADIITSGGLYPPNAYYVHLLVADGDPVAGVAGVRVAIDYGSGQTDGVGIDVFSWSLCATLEMTIGAWPASGQGNTITWQGPGTCQQNEPGGAGTGVMANAGYFYVAAYSAAEMKLIPVNDPGHPAQHNKVQIGDCSAVTYTIYDGASPPSPSPLGVARFSANAANPGYNPCLNVIPVENTTWSRIKGVTGR